MGGESRSGNNKAAERARERNVRELVCGGAQETAVESLFNHYLGQFA